MFEKLHKRTKGEGGFTLIELLVVIIIIAILAAIAIPTFLGQRNKAQDTAAKSNIRNAMMSMESAYVDTRDFQDVDKPLLEGIEPSLTFTDEANAASTAIAEAWNDQVSFHSTDPDIYEMGSKSRSDTLFGVIVDKTAGGGGTTYYTYDADGTLVATSW